MVDKDGGPAFPTERFDNSLREFPVGYHGMTLRDYFAAQALAYLANRDCFRPENAQAPEAASIIAINVYTIADAMLKERAK